MKTVDDTKLVEDWLRVIRIATDVRSPFAGMVDLTEIFALPLDTQRRIHAGLSQDELARVKELYGPKGGE